MTAADCHAMEGTSHLMRHFFLAAIGAALVFPIILSDFGYQPQQTLLAIVLLDVCTYPTARYFARKESGLPAMPIFCLAYALQFAVPFFTHNASIGLAEGDIKELNESDVTAALLLATIGICALLSGYYSFQKSRFRRAIPAAPLHLNKFKAVMFCGFLGLLLPLLFNLRAIIPEEYQLPLSAILRLLQNQVFVVIGVLGWIVYERQGSKWYALWLYVLVIVATLRGISTATLEEALVPLGVLFLVKWLHTRRVSPTLVVTVVALVLFLSPVKGEYRQQVWRSDALGDEEMSPVSKASLWIKQATEYWSDTLSGGRNLAEATFSATSRADFLHQVAHIYSMTPAVVPYQYGGTYSYFAVALIPRAIWPNKPMAGNANGFFAVSYGLTTEEGVKTTTFGVSLLGEAFINFGWVGVVFVMLLQGLVIALLERIFGSADSGAGGQAVFIAFFVFFLNGIGSSAEILFGNVLQNLICGYFLLLWARERQILLQRGATKLAQLAHIDKCHIES